MWERNHFYDLQLREVIGRNLSEEEWDNFNVLKEKSYSSTTSPTWQRQPCQRESEAGQCHGGLCQEQGCFCEEDQDGLDMLNVQYNSDFAGIDGWTVPVAAERDHWQTRANRHRTL